ncbi:hypothetical protein ACFY4C_13305 [Actinomadura viridis]|uniref:hypothetical protein n=1 Tax=Actinomadura viridis TaxID=58110 RepID=UPI003689F2FE
MLDPLLRARWALAFARRYADPAIPSADVVPAAAGDMRPFLDWVGTGCRRAGYGSSEPPGVPGPGALGRAPSGDVAGLLYVAPPPLQAAFWRSVLGDLLDRALGLGGAWTDLWDARERIRAALATLGAAPSGATPAAGALPAAGSRVLAPARGRVGRVLDDLAYATVMADRSLRAGASAARNTGWRGGLVPWTVGYPGEPARAEAIRAAGEAGRASGLPDGFLLRAWTGIGLAGGPFHAAGGPALPPMRGRPEVRWAVPGRPSPGEPAPGGPTSVRRDLVVGESGLVVAATEYHFWDGYYTEPEWTPGREWCEIRDPGTGRLVRVLDGGLRDVVGRVVYVAGDQGRSVSAHDLVTGERVEPAPGFGTGSAGRGAPRRRLDDPAGEHQEETLAGEVVYRSDGTAIDARDSATGAPLWRLSLDARLPEGHRVHRMVPAPRRLYVLTDRNLLLYLTDDQD